MEKCVKGDAHKMIGHLEDLREIWASLILAIRDQRSIWKRISNPFWSSGSTGYLTMAPYENYTQF
jgi:hypothetical protein